MDRVRHINTRNLVVCDVFDDFAAAVNKTDFIVEDCVGYVVSLANVYYWLNVETVWGAIGFTWTYTEDVSDDEAREFPHPYYRMKHVEADGTNIEMDDEWLIENKVKRGYGVFNRTTIPFTHIPALPDGYRIMRFTGSTIQNIASNIIYIDKSDWRNLTNINSLCNSNKTIYADFDGAPIASASYLLDTDANSGKLYLKANLSGLPKNGSFNLFRVGDHTGQQKMLICNDYYKDLNIFIGEDNTSYTNLHLPSSYYGGWNKANLRQTLRWEGSDAFKLEYWFNFKNYLQVYTDSYAGASNIDSATAKYYVNNFINYDDSIGKGLYFRFMDRSLRTNTDTIDLTIDCTNGASDVRLDYDLTYRHSTTSYTNGRMYPIKYIGNVTSIGTYNPYLLVENDEWPEFSQDLVNKLNPAYGEYILEKINCTDSVCPYTINMANKTYFRIFDLGVFTFNDTSRRVQIPNFSNYYYDVYPTLTNTSQKFDDAIFTARIPGNANCVLFPLTTLKADTVTFRQGYYFKSGTKIEFTRWNSTTHQTAGGLNNSTIVENSDIPVFSIKKNNNLSFYINIANPESGDAIWGFIKWYSSSNITNLFETDIDFESEDDINILKASTISTYIGKPGYTTTHPVIKSNVSGGGNGSNDYTNVHYTNFKFIYNSNINLAYTGYTDQEYIDFVRAFVPIEEGKSPLYNEVRLRHSEVEKFQNDIFDDGHSLEEILVDKGYRITGY